MIVNMTVLLLSSDCQVSLFKTTDSTVTGWGKLCENEFDVESLMHVHGGWRERDYNKLA